MRLGLSGRVFVGFVVLIGVFVAAMVLSISRMHAIREDLTLLHRGFLQLSKSVTQIRTLKEARAADLDRALSEADPVLQQRLLAFARDHYPVAIDERLTAFGAKLDALNREGPLRPRDRRALNDLSEDLGHVRRAAKTYDDAVASARSDTEFSVQADAFERALRTLSFAVDSLVDESVSRAERDERAAAALALGLTVLGSLLGIGVFLATRRGLLPLTHAVKRVRSIARREWHAVDVTDAPREIAELTHALDELAHALEERDGVLAARTAELLRLSDFAENVIRAVRVGIVVVDSTSTIRTLNPAARAVFSLPLVDVEGRLLADAFADRDVELFAVMQAVARVRNDGEISRFDNVKDHERLLDVTLVPLRDRGGHSVGDVLMLGEDVTAREATRTRLLHSERLAAIGRLAAQITHEIRNPLSSVALNVELLADDVATLPEPRRVEAEQIIAAVHDEVNRLVHITEGYLRFARLKDAPVAPLDLDVTPQLGDMGDVVADLLAFSQADAAHAGVTLELNIQTELPTLRFDPASLRQALLNLLRNALEAAGRGGTVRVSVGRGPIGLDVRFADSGAGLSLEAQARIFEPFFTTKTGGTGLGLVLTRQVARAHGGDVHVETSELGGAAFVLSLPV